VPADRGGAQAEHVAERGGSGRAAGEQELGDLLPGTPIRARALDRAQETIRTPEIIGTREILNGSRCFHYTSVTYFRRSAQTTTLVILYTLPAALWPRVRRSYHVGVNAIRRIPGNSILLRLSNSLLRLSNSILLRRLALASMIANVGIVATGGAVRLTGSGLGCPTWPKCDGSSYVTTAAMGYHGEIEFTNRTLTFVVGVLAALCVVVALAQPVRDRGQVRWSVLVLASIPAQAVLGGITVLTKLNPWVVACHFLLSTAVIAAAYQLWIRTRPRASRTETVPRPLGWLAGAIIGATGLVLAAGTVVTGSGPHAGDADARRTGLDPAQVAQLHTDLVMLLIGLSVAACLALYAVGAPLAARAAVYLVIIECAQAVVGFVQYFTHLPIGLVDLHMIGACLVLLAALTLRTATVPPARPSGADPAELAVPDSLAAALQA
jgi:heme a synthase